MLPSTVQWVDKIKYYVANLESGPALFNSFSSTWRFCAFVRLEIMHVKELIIRHVKAVHIQFKRVCSSKLQKSSKNITYSAVVPDLIGLRPLKQSVVYL